MIAIYLLPLFIFMLGFVCYWLIRWLSVCSSFFKKWWVRILIILINYLIMACMYVAAIMPHNYLQHIVRLIGNFWYGFALYTIMVVVAAFLLRQLVKKINKDSFLLHSRAFGIFYGAVCFLTILVVCIGGIFNAKNIRTTQYDVTIQKDGGKLKDLKVVLIADLHIGHNIRCKQMQQMVDKVNACNPDIIVIGGDIFDNEYDAVQDPERMIEVLKGMKAPYGIYATYGNHDIEEPIIGGFTFPSSSKKVSHPLMDEFIEKCGFKLLKDESILIEDSVYIYGRPDEERPNRDIDERKEPEEFMQTMDQSKPIIVVEHEPKMLDALDAAKVDLHLAGHTHDGQVFPLTITNDIIWENGCGYLQKDYMQSIVTSGVGLYGPNMRVATIPEICDITVHFQ